MTVCLPEVFDVRQREAGLYAASQLTPANYHGAGNKVKIANCYIALDIAQRLNVNPLMVMQNLYEVKGRFGWSTQFLIACFNACGRFGPLEYEEEGEAHSPEYRVRCRAKDLAGGHMLAGPWVSMATAVKAGWSKNPLWQSIPDLMLRYRAAAFFIRTTAPELAMGFYTTQELEDIPEERPARKKAKSEPDYSEPLEDEALEDEAPEAPQPDEQAEED